jgi:hypothetical protein
VVAASIWAENTRPTYTQPNFWPEASANWSWRGAGSYVKGKWAMAKDATVTIPGFKTWTWPAGNLLTWALGIVSPVRVDEPTFNVAIGTYGREWVQK